MPHHRRLVLGIHHGATNGDLMQHAAEMARLLDIELHGIFVEDEAVLGVAALPFVREFRLHSHQWHELDTESIEAEFRHAANNAKRLLDRVAKARGVRMEFHIQRGSPSAVVAGLLSAGDIMVLAEPKPGPGALTQSFMRAFQTARGSNASVLLLPPGPTRDSGPVVALVMPGRDVRTATYIASQTGDSLILLGPPESLATVTTELPADRVERRPLYAMTESAFRLALGDRGERLFVLHRNDLSADDEAVLLRFAAARGTPVLLVGSTPEG